MADLGLSRLQGLSLAVASEGYLQSQQCSGVLAAVASHCGARELQSLQHGVSSCSPRLWSIGFVKPWHTGLVAL